jgi:hypothetical protein
MIYVNNFEGLIGDFLGTIPAMQKLAEKDELLVKIHPEIEGLFKLIENDRIKGTFDSMSGKDFIKLSNVEAFKESSKLNCYMSSAFMVAAGLDFPKVSPKAKLTYEINTSTLPIGPIDYLISPFARSLSESNKWQREKWQELVKKLPDKTFGVLGNYKYDDPMYINSPNVQNFYSLSFDVLCRLFKNCKALISVVTGTSHLAFHLGVKNILLTNQTMAWGNNPDAIKITDQIPDLKVETVIAKL